MGRALLRSGRGERFGGTGRREEVPVEERHVDDLETLEVLLILDSLDGGARAETASQVGDRGEHGEPPRVRVAAVDEIPVDLQEVRPDVEDRLVVRMSE